MLGALIIQTLYNMWLLNHLMEREEFIQERAKREHSKERKKRGH